MIGWNLTHKTTEKLKQWTQHHSNATLPSATAIQVHYINNKIHSSISQTSHAAWRKQNIFSTPTKEKQALFCIHEAGEPKTSGVTLPSRVCKVVRSELMIGGHFQITNKLHTRTHGERLQQSLQKSWWGEHYWIWTCFTRYKKGTLMCYEADSQILKQ